MNEPDHSAGVTVTCRVPEANGAAFESTLQDLMAAGASHPGRVSAEVLRGPAAGGVRVYHVIYRFADPASLAAWEGSDARRTLLAKLAPLMTEAGRQPLTGMEAWFDLPSSAPPSRDRMAVVTWIGIWPLVSLALWLVAPHLGALPFLARTAVTTAAVVVLMTYVVMPRLARLADPWLRPTPQGG